MLKTKSDFNSMHQSRLPHEDKLDCRCLFRLMIHFKAREGAEFLQVKDHTMIDHIWLLIESINIFSLEDDLLTIIEVLILAHTTSGSAEL